jgi:hypothetical protein
MAAWKSSAAITGGFMWLFDDMQACSSQGTAAQYANAINTAVGTTPTPGTPGPTPTFPPNNLAKGKPATGSAPCTSSEGPEKAVNGSVTLGNSDKFCSTAATKFLRVDLQSSYSLTSFIVRHAGAGSENPIYNTRDFTIETSLDGNTWSAAATITGNAANVSSHPVAPRNARYIRLTIVHGTQENDATARIYELEAYGSAVTPAPRPQPRATPTATARVAPSPPRPGNTPTATATATRTATATPTINAAAWQPGLFYTVGAKVTHAGLTYSCIQAHSSLVGWEPPNTPALWLRL